MKVLDNSFSRNIHISGEILKFTLCTDICSTVNKNGWFFIFYKKECYACRRKRYVVSEIHFLVLWVLANSYLVMVLLFSITGGKTAVGALYTTGSSRILQDKYMSA